jgi:hypothetical protein
VEARLHAWRQHDRVDAERRHAEGAAYLAEARPLADAVDMRYRPSVPGACRGVLSRNRHLMLRALSGIVVAVRSGERRGSLLPDRCEQRGAVEEDLLAHPDRDVQVLKRGGIGGSCFR